jgi:hypothetical protein
MRFRKRGKESQKQYEQRKREVLSHLDNDNTFLKTQDLNFKDLLTVIVDHEGESYQDKEFKKSKGEGQFRVYKCFEVWTLDDLTDEGIEGGKALSILGMVK